MQVRITRALLSVYDKTGVVELGRALVRRGVELVSSGGTARALMEAGVPVTTVEDVTGAPEMLEHRVVTLHPKIHGGILADLGKDSHRADLETYGIAPFDLVVVNLYPFTAQPGIETIDVGGPTMVRAAAKNHAWVTILTSPDQYAPFLAELDANDGMVSESTRRECALAAFAATAAFDAAIVAWMQSGDAMPEHLILPLERVRALRYGENPHQAGAHYRNVLAAPGWPEICEQLQGKELSFINLLDGQAAWSMAQRFSEPACVIVKHANPCGVALGADLLDAYTRAFACDDVSAFGGVVACNREVDGATAKAIGDVFTEVVLAPGFSAEARELLAGKINLRLLIVPPDAQLADAFDLRRIDGGFLVQERDAVQPDASEWTVVTDVAPTDAQWRDLHFAWEVCAGVTSNAIVLARDGQALGIGAGQQSRVHAAEIAARKAGDRAQFGVCASDAFFPFRDGVDAAAAAGVRAIVQPGGSMRDDEVIAAANEHGIAMVFTGRRHFRH
ncbi:MAG: bifunctional phosphoribosylaminoimidazolecarboxamide formyltransferase/IMP cyclohydrolase [Acidimicrobiia bacterium]